MTVFPSTQFISSNFLFFSASKQGGTFTRYINFIQEKGFADNTYSARSSALFRVQGSSLENMQAIQVNMVRTDNSQTRSS